jgi:hypothetical protein
MFSLIITIISIALVAALAVATIYYGGSAWSEGQINAQAGTLLNQAQQIAGAVEIHRAQTGMWPADIGTLTSNGEWLREAPSPGAAADGAWVVGSGGGAVTLEDVNTEVCEKVAERQLPGVTCDAGVMSFAVTGS